MFLFYLAFIHLFSNASVFIIKVDTSINPASARFIINSINEAEKENAALFIIELDTPGGLVTSTRSIVQKILNAKIPIAVNVSPSGAHAGSAGVMITLAANIASMAPGTNIGAAHPISMLPFSTNSNKKSETKNEKNIMEEKSVNDVVAFVRSIARARNRNEVWASEAVLKNSTLIAEEALKMRVIDFVVKDSDELINKLNAYEYMGVDKVKKTIFLDAVTIVKRTMSFKLKFINFFADPNVAFFLIIIAAIGLYLEFSHPGLILPGVFGVISFILFLMSTQILPINASGFILILLGLVLIISELFITSGILGTGGVISIITGSLFFIDPFKSDLSISNFVIWPMGGFLIFSVLFITYLIYKSKNRKISSGVSAPVGVTMSDKELVAQVVDFDILKKTGRVKINSEYWNLVSEDILKDGDFVLIIERTGLILKGVKKNV